MTPDDLREARQKLGYTQRELGHKLRMKPASAERTVRRWERAEVEISGPAQVAILALLSGFDPDE